MANHIKYYFSVQHLEQYTGDWTAKSYYERIISTHNTLDDAIEQLVQHALITDPDIKYDIDRIVDKIRTHADDVDRDGYRICFEEISDAKKFYFGPGAYTITREVLS